MLSHRLLHRLPNCLPRREIRCVLADAMTVKPLSVERCWEGNLSPLFHIAKNCQVSRSIFSGPDFWWSFPRFDRCEKVKQKSRSFSVIVFCALTRYAPQVKKTTCPLCKVRSFNKQWCTSSVFELPLRRCVFVLCGFHFVVPLFSQSFVGR